MDATHIHLMVNHIPILFIPVALIILIWGWMRDIKPFQTLSMWGFILAAVAAYIAFESGEGAEETVERLAGVREQFIHEHEEWAEWSLWGSIILGIAAIAGLYIDRIKKQGSSLLISALIILALVTSGLMAYTAYLGGQIRHTEIRSQQTQVDQPAEEPESEGNDH